MYAIEHRNQLTGRWGWMLVSGIIDLILAGIIFAGLPGTAAWALGLLVGINMLFGGAAHDRHGAGGAASGIHVRADADASRTCSRANAGTPLARE